MGRQAREDPPDPHEAHLSRPGSHGDNLHAGCFTRIGVQALPWLDPLREPSGRHPVGGGHEGEVRGQGFIVYEERFRRHIV